MHAKVPSRRRNQTDACAGQNACNSRDPSRLHQRSQQGTRGLLGKSTGPTNKRCFIDRIKFLIQRNKLFKLQSELMRSTE
jgi:hypothetical protein